MFSAKKLSVLNKLYKYIAALYKGQLGNAGGDVLLGDLLGNFRVVFAGSITQATQTTNTTVVGLLTTDTVVAVLDTDDTVNAAVCITATVPAADTLRTVSVGAAGGTDAVVKYFVLRAQS